MTSFILGLFPPTKTPVMCLCTVAVLNLCISSGPKIINSIFRILKKKKKMFNVVRAELLLICFRYYMSNIFCCDKFFEKRC